MGGTPHLCIGLRTGRLLFRFAPQRRFSKRWALSCVCPVTFLVVASGNSQPSTGFPSRLSREASSALRRYYDPFSGKLHLYLVSSFGGEVLELTTESILASLASLCSVGCHCGFFVGAFAAQLHWMLVTPSGRIVFHIDLSPAGVGKGELTHPGLMLAAKKFVTGVDSGQVLDILLNSCIAALKPAICDAIELMLPQLPLPSSPAPVDSDAPQPPLVNLALRSADSQCLNQLSRYPLESLEISWCRNIRDLSFLLPQGVSAGASKLKRLQLGNSRFDDSCFLSIHLPQLRELDLRFSRKTPKLSTLTHCPSLTKLNLLQCHFVCLEEITSLKFLKELDISSLCGNRPSSYSKLGELMALEVLTATSSSFNDDAVDAISCLPELKKLDLSSSKIANPRGFALMAKVRVLVLSFCVDLRTEALLSIAQMSSLEYLDISKCKSIGSVNDLARGAKELRELKMNGLTLSPCCSLSVEFGRQLKCLSKLSLADTVNFDFSVLPEIKSLKCVDASSTAITDDDVAALSAIHLKELRLLACGTYQHRAVFPSLGKLQFLRTLAIEPVNIQFISPLSLVDLSFPAMVNHISDGELAFLRGMLDTLRAVEPSDILKRLLSLQTKEEITERK